ncbi:MAG: tetratricopeptide repeat protein, partial [Candidatus Riflebacteria bacterium]|nr:tetratricopeptide repeat protein [Candidatus Riflebacteria bacterium]
MTKIPLALLAVFLFFSSAISGQTRLESLAAASPSDPAILNSYGIERANAGDLTGAIEVWRKALDYDRRNVHLYNNIGSALKRLGQDHH